MLTRKKLSPQRREHPFNVMMRENRIALGLSQRELANRIGSGSRSYLAHIEEGRYAVSVELGLAICQVLDIPPHLCIDYICTVEQERLRDRIKQDYQEWIDMTPDNVKEKMLGDELSQQLHTILLEV